MTCDKARLLITLRASDDATSRELEALNRHLDGCAHCAADAAAFRPLVLRDVRAELPFDEAVLGEMRNRVMQKVASERTSSRNWIAFAIRGAAVAAALVLIVIALRPGARTKPTAPKSVTVTKELTPRMIAEPLPHPPTAIVAIHHHQRRPQLRRDVETASAVLSAPPRSPIRMEIHTSDPNVRIIWIATPEPDSTQRTDRSRSK